MRLALQIWLAPQLAFGLVLFIALLIKHIRRNKGRPT